MNSTCFLVDDDLDDREIFAIALEEADKNCTCITANNGVDALNKLKTEPGFIPHYIFLDLNMPMMDGKQSLAEMKKIPRIRPVPVIIYTTSSRQKDMEETERLGAAHYLIKPHSIDQLSEILLQLFQKQDLPFCLSWGN